jgi:uncharacterized protein YfaS (alpha-2-macroglobulin family)
MKIFLFLLLFLSCLLQASAQKNNSVAEPWAKQWEKVNYLVSQNRPKSALRMLDSIYKIGKAKFDIVTTLKAQLYIFKIIRDTSNSDFEILVSFAEQAGKEERFPNNAIWQSIAAQTYWNYYLTNKENIKQRQRLAKETEITDFTQWDKGRFFEKCTSLYMKSLSKSEELKNFDISQFDAVLTGIDSNAPLSPTLFDLLTYRALEYLDNDDADIAKTTNPFVLNMASVFSPAGAFTGTKLDTKDFTSFKWLSMQWYKELLKFHENDSSKDAYVEADLQRLAFAYKHSILPNKKQLYIQALQFIEDNFGNFTSSAEAAFIIAAFNAGVYDNYLKTGYFFLATAAPTKADSKINFTPIIEKLRQIATKFPKSIGCRNATTLLHAIEHKEFSFENESAVIPNEASKILFTYRNINTVNLKVIRITQSELVKFYGDGSVQNTFSKRMPLINENISLRGSDDHYEHTTEIKIDPLPIGAYAILLSGNNSSESDAALTAVQYMQVSSMVFVSPDKADPESKNFILDRKTGYPMPNVKIFNVEIRQSKKSKTKPRFTGTDGAFFIKPSKNCAFCEQRLFFISGADTLYESVEKNNFEQEKIQKYTTYFFTDRAIYRPGQQLFFKGIIVQTNKYLDKKTARNKKTVVKIKDPFGNILHKAEFQTNDFGSFHGSFTIPENIPMGELSIENESGSNSFSVEAYKRPKFKIEFDTLKQAISYYDKIKIKGRVSNFNGSACDGLPVKYTVKHFPENSWRGETESDLSIYTTGSVKTDKEGRFIVPVTLFPDTTGRNDSSSISRFTVAAEVTDLNGETQTQDFDFFAGYCSIKILSNIPEFAIAEKLKYLDISTENINGGAAFTLMNIKIFALESPARIYRKRLWAAPELPLLNIDSFKNYFPEDEYANESDPGSLNIKSKIMDTDIYSREDQKIQLPSNIWKASGIFRIEISAKDSKGQNVCQTKYFEVINQGDAHTLQSPIALAPDFQLTTPGDTANVQVFLGFDSCVLFQLENNAKDQYVYTEQMLTNSATIWRKTVKEDDIGGISLSFMFFRNNRLFTKNAVINVPWTNKQLKLDLETHRDKAVPGETETWTLKLKNTDSSAVNAELAATMYDASLDKFRRNDWKTEGIFNSVKFDPEMTWQGAPQTNTGSPYDGNNEGNSFENPIKKQLLFIGDADSDLPYPKWGIRYKLVSFNKTSPVGDWTKAKVADSMTSKEETAPMHPMPVRPTVKFIPPSMHHDEEIAATNSSSRIMNAYKFDAQYHYRRNLIETAFFYPHLKTDDSGNIRLKFTLPEALTDWKFVSFAHTKNMATVTLESFVNTQKTIMVMPNLPRFLRQGDTVSIAAKITNLTDTEIAVVAHIELADALTQKKFDVQCFPEGNQDILTSVSRQSSGTIIRKIVIPQTVINPVTVKIAATSGVFTDGEENTLPVLTDRNLIEESEVFIQNGNGTKQYQIKGLLNTDTIRSITTQSLTLEYSSNPAWHALLSMPSLMEAKNDCAEQIFNQYFASVLAQHLLHKYPKLESIINNLKSTDSVTLLSNLERNDELKNVLLSETPWLLQAKNETEQKNQIISLFKREKLAHCRIDALTKLQTFQTSTGGFGWCGNSVTDRFITQYILAGFGKLAVFGADISDAKNLITAGLEYADRQLRSDYDILVRNKSDLSWNQTNNSDILYLYMRSYFKDIPVSASCTTAFKYFFNQSIAFKNTFGTAQQAMLAVAFHRNGNIKAANELLASFKETAHRNTNTGMYFDAPIKKWDIWNSPIETEAAMMECFNEVGKDSASVDEMKHWLLTEKRSNRWQSSKATAEAIYAMLLTKNQLEGTEPSVKITLGDTVIVKQKLQPQKKEKMKDLNSNKGTGYFKVGFDTKAVSSKMGNISVSVSNNDNNTSYGAVYWQYFAPSEKIFATNNGLSVTKTLYKKRLGLGGATFQPVSDTTVLQIGEQLIVHLELQSQYDMDYVHLKDLNCSGLEPKFVPSGFNFEDGLGYYRTFTDVAVNYFIDHLPAGKFNLDYPVYVSHSGNFSVGIAGVQCMYAPEYNGHSAGTRISVR